MNRRDLLLHQMQIPQWVLRKPQVLKGDAQIRLEQQIKLVVVCDEDYRQSQLFSDILLALNLNNNEYQWLSLEQALRLTISHSPLIWLISPQEQADEFVKKFANSTAWRHSSWQMLSQAQTKRQLWQQMLQHFPDIEDVEV
ncbi:DNA polymerase III psi subunit protein [Bibersteinia trehalosi USDA-ARS-USMARC-188]|uniref:DNA polymerase III subunit psi n=4 Tax=Bibersteinia trehalosi TaxID=47735 RepID=W0R9D3_BIBTR|nr:DNA polymerase III subunit psi [Bibersteinia trehalosi]AGH38016.1 DNA polymerase III psi subunit protein [Bibersteinia trehalosi USDA-ARS-USMARC-192]AHG82184.1 DNA polymerase III psi subunit protein [Bibersteinia trehalosi USDA-ARS-USMARC-188]AHG84496.1 DNA polymerase III psi subunit protein [Bibersteinia trehalosi USDA-ARS-USMARC-189]AHG86003.1 DNA polymerase III psi subunit protein [Bibersteinia trehalosi USDA-ARS-USMARC-190]OAQ15466.1 DNA polymerase III subunit psi [Bibersteinia trehalos